MSYELELNKTNRLKLARVFRNHKRVDSSIDCVIEGQMGKAFVNDITHPQLTVSQSDRFGTLQVKPIALAVIR